jgi:hypothetical protein
MLGDNRAIFMDILRCLNYLNMIILMCIYIFYSNLLKSKIKYIVFNNNWHAIQTLNDTLITLFKKILTQFLSMTSKMSVISVAIIKDLTLKYVIAISIKYCV